MSQGVRGSRGNPQQLFAGFSRVSLLETNLPKCCFRRLEGKINGLASEPRIGLTEMGKGNTTRIWNW